ncbi:MAG: hypothetical protein ABS41_13265 [Arenimonas sp. SCN 70-307]|uniref:hypothetical protein n=1 Tax=Arenimonas sp. SCN 70-307 TaxID=1660089 RepID=UPI00086B9404|nr:hypothetical protein [Arenimonas sp. SCN 70-307]ODS61307.1 MAG: hypothetical protein ABS41_13265 [Arenimonas sp. SCN 70-307]
MTYLVLAGLVLALALHFYALHVSRQGRSVAHTVAFWGGCVGMLSVPVAILAAVAYLPFSIAGAGDHPIGWFMPASWVAVVLLGGCSFVASLAAKRRPAV